MNIAFQIGDKQQIRINGMIVFPKIRLYTVADRYRKIGLYRTIQMISHFNPGKSPAQKDDTGRDPFYRQGAWKNAASHNKNARITFPLSD